MSNQIFLRKHDLFDYISIIHLQAKVRVSIRFRVRVGNRVRGRVRVRNTKNSSLKQIQAFFGVF